jgi:hypothetical protein
MGPRPRGNRWGNLASVFKDDAMDRRGRGSSTDRGLDAARCTRGRPCKFADAQANLTGTRRSQGRTSAPTEKSMTWSAKSRPSRERARSCKTPTSSSRATPDRNRDPTNPGQHHHRKIGRSGAFSVNISSSRPVAARSLILTITRIRYSGLNQRALVASEIPTEPGSLGQNGSPSLLAPHPREVALGLDDWIAPRSFGSSNTTWSCHAPGGSIVTFEGGHLGLHGGRRDPQR